VPSGSTTRRAFAHGFKPGGDLLERAFRRGGGNDETDQSVITSL